MHSSARKRVDIEPLEARRLLAVDAYNWSNAVIKGNGFVNGVVYSPAAPNVAYAYTDMGGAYRWDASVQRWSSVSDWSKWSDWSAQNMGVEAMAVDPVDPNRVYMIIGTYNSPAAVLRSSDGGRTWSRYDSPWDNANARPAWRVNGNGNGRNGGDRLLVDPNKPSNLWYGSRLDGLWRSTDSGANWSRANAFPVTGDTSGDASEVGIVFVVADPSSGASGVASRSLYAGVSTSNASKLYRSLDGGNSWSILPGQPATVPNSTGAGVTAYPIRAAIRPTGSELFITYASNPGPNGAAGGAVYKVVAPASASPIWSDLKPGGANPYFGYSGIALHPTDPNTLYISTLDRWYPSDEIYRSTNDGATWTALTPKNHLDNSSAPFANTQSPHWVGDIDIDPFNPNVMTFTTGYGLYRTANLSSGAGANWSFFNDGLDQSAVLELASPNDGPVNLFSAIGDRDGFRHDRFDVSPSIGQFGANTRLNVGTNYDVDVAFSAASNVVRLTGTSPYVQFSLDNGITWNWMSATNTAGASSGGGHLAISNDGTRVLYEPAGTARLRYATLAGSTWSSWTTLSGTYPANGATLTSDLVNNSTFYAQSGRTFWRSTDGGLTWTTRTTTAPTNINWVRAVPNNEGHLLASTGSSGNGVWRSMDGGATWTRLATATVTHALAVGVGAGPTPSGYPSLFVAGTAGGVTGYFRSDDQGATWINISDADHQFGYITVIQGDPRVYGRLYVGANGRGVLVAERADVVAPVVTSATFDYRHTPVAIEIAFSENVGASVSVTDLVVAGPSGAVAAVSVSFDARTNVARFTLPASLAPGDYVATVAAAAVSDGAGNTLAGDVTIPFFHLPGDIDRDRSVSFSDLLIVAQHYGESGADFEAGDLNGDGIVGFDDLLVVAQSYGSLALLIPAQLTHSRQALTKTRRDRLV